MTEANYLYEEHKKTPINKTEIDAKDYLEYWIIAATIDLMRK